MGSCTKGELTDETMVLVSVTCVPVVNTEFKNRVYPADTAGMGGDGVNRLATGVRVNTYSQ